MFSHPGYGMGGGGYGMGGFGGGGGPMEETVVNNYYDNPGGAGGGADNSNLDLNDNRDFADTGANDDLRPVSTTLPWTTPPIWIRETAAVRR